MNEIKINSTPQSSDSSAVDSPPIRVAGVYCDESACITATLQLQSIGNTRSSVGTFDSTWWSFESLKHSPERQEAVRAVAEADMIWCSVCACEPLPETVKTWMEGWSAKKHKTDAALVALLRCPLARNVEQSSTRLCLCAAARAAGMQFFERKSHYNGPQPQSAVGEFNIPPPLASPPDVQAFRGWGIND